MSKIILTQAELLEIVPELRAMAAAEPAEKVREALNRLVDRYSSMSDWNRIAAPMTQVDAGPRRSHS